MPATVMLADRALLARVQALLSMNQIELARALGVSRRTITRWVSGDTHPIVEYWVEMARLALPAHRALAVEIADALGSDLVKLGLEAPPPPAPAPPAPPPAPAEPAFSLPDRVDSVVCAAAEAMAVAPQAVRPALLAALERMKALELDPAQVREGLVERARAPRP